MVRFGKNLRARAKELGLSDAEVARRCGLNERRYGFYVTGDREPDLATLARIAGVLDCSIDKLIGDDVTRVEGGSRSLPLSKLISACQTLPDTELDLLVILANALQKRASNSS